MYARPHPNGDTPQTFRSEARRLHELALEADRILLEFSGGTMHGRNYQHSENPDVERNADLLRVKLAREAIAEVLKLSIECFHNGSD